MIELSYRGKRGERRASAGELEPGDLMLQLSLASFAKTPLLNDERRGYSFLRDRLSNYAHLIWQEN